MENRILMRVGVRYEKNKKLLGEAYIKKETLLEKLVPLQKELDEIDLAIERLIGALNENSRVVEMLAEELETHAEDIILKKEEMREAGS